jgi:hypothetical protein
MKVSMAAPPIRYVSIVLDRWGDSGCMLQKRERE